jgi:hypothetical protein
VSNPKGVTVFQTERDVPMTPPGFRKTLARIGEASELGFPSLLGTCALGVGRMTKLTVIEYRTKKAKQSQRIASYFSAIIVNASAWKRTCFQWLDEPSRS